ncbi:unnamed protein product [Trichobilharzia regenti]|nr:unnamed protein product [Trichobilharzia regenti]
MSFSLPKTTSLLGAVFYPASVERGHYLRASLALAWLTEPEIKNEIEDDGDDDTLNSGIDLGGKEPDDEPLLDYDIGVFEERKFQLRILIPGPTTEPDYEKAFRLVILDASNRLDIRVKRAVQPPNEMALRRIYGQLSDVDLLPSLAARQQAIQDSLLKGNSEKSDYAYEISDDRKFSKREANNQPHSSTYNQKMTTRSDVTSDQRSSASSPSSSSSSSSPPPVMRSTFGPSSALVYSVVCILLILSFILFIGYVTEPGTYNIALLGISFCFTHYNLIFKGLIMS